MLEEVSTIKLVWKQWGEDIKTSRKFEPNVCTDSH